MKILVIDTETTGLPKERNSSIFAVEEWPHIIQLSYIVYDSIKREVLTVSDNIVLIDDSIELTERSIELHGITREKSKREGIHILNLLKNLNLYLESADIVVGHNISFDKRMIMVECIRHNIRSSFSNGKVKKQEYCTMKNSVDLCKIEKISMTGEKYYKYPTLSELHNNLFGTIPTGVHNSLVDILICLRCYIKLTENYDIAELDEIKNLIKMN